MTGKEAAQIKGTETGDREKILGFFLIAPARELQQYIHETSASTDRHMYQRAKIALSIRLAEDAEKISGRLYILTWALLVLTVALLFFTIALYKDSHALTQREKLQEQHDTKRQ